MNNGYVSVPREFFNSIQWRRKRVFTESEAYLDLLQMAYYGSEPIERVVGRRTFVLKRGQIVTTTAFLAERWGWKVHRVRYVLRALSVTSFLTFIVTSGRTIISVNQDNINSVSEKSVTSFLTSIVNNKNKITKKKITKKSVEGGVVCDTTTHAQAEGEAVEPKAEMAKPGAEMIQPEVAQVAEVAQIAEAAEAKPKPAAEPKPAKRRRTAPMQRPTVWEVENFCRTQGLLLVDAQRFVDYYEANGWRVGRNPMRSWQAAARNWQRRELQYQPTAMATMAANSEPNLFTEPNCAVNHEHPDAVQPALDAEQQPQLALPQQPQLVQPQQPKLAQPQPRQPQPRQPQPRQPQPLGYRPQPALWQRQQYATKAGACAEALEQYAARQMRYFASMGAEEPDF